MFNLNLSEGLQAFKEPSEEELLYLLREYDDDEDYYEDEDYEDDYNGEDYYDEEDYEDYEDYDEEEY